MTQLEYGKVRRRWWHLPRPIVVAGVIAIALPALALLILSSRFCYTSICPICGEVEYVSEWKIPFTDHTCFTSKSTHKTLLSAALAKHRATPGHTHQWDFATGGGSGVRCALGEGRYLWQIANRSDVAAFVDATLAYGNAAQRIQLLTIMQDHERVIQLANAIGFARFPDQGVTDAKTYATWWTANQTLWDDWWRDLR